MYVLRNHTNCIDYRLVSWQKCSVVYDLIKNYVSDTHFESSYVFRPIMFMYGFTLSPLYINEMASNSIGSLLSDFWLSTFLLAQKGSLAITVTFGMGKWEPKWQYPLEFTVVWIIEWHQLRVDRITEVTVNGDSTACPIRRRAVPGLQAEMTQWDGQTSHGPARARGHRPVSASGSLIITCSHQWVLTLARVSCALIVIAPAQLNPPPWSQDGLANR